MNDVRTDTVVLGLGNRFAGDDAVGLLVAERVAARLPDVTVVEGAGDAIAILAAWEGCTLAVVVDAAVSGAAPGTLHRFENEAALRPKALARCSSHGSGLAEALALADALDRRPPILVVHAVEIGSLVPGAPLSRAVAAAIDPLVARIVHEIVGDDDRRVRLPVAYPTSRHDRRTDRRARSSVPARHQYDEENVMHEASVMDTLMRRIDEVARAENARRVVGLTVRLGALSHMSPTHFREHFAVSSLGTPAAGAALDIETSDDATDPEAEEIRLVSVEIE